MNEAFKNITSVPKSFSATQVLIRLIDGSGFRFYWATEGLVLSDYAYKPSEDLMSIEELIFHIEDLARMCCQAFGLELESKAEVVDLSREATLGFLSKLKMKMNELSEAELSQVQIKGFPIWNMINGPLADALTHVGQINAYRRANGNPTPKVSVFVGKVKS